MFHERSLTARESFLRAEQSQASERQIALLRTALCHAEDNLAALRHDREELEQAYLSKVRWRTVMLV